MSNVFNLRDGVANVSPPMSIEAEQALLGVLISDRDTFALVSTIVDAEHFFEPLHQTIYAAIRDLAREGRPATLVTVGAALSSVETPPSLPPVKAYLANLFANGFSSRDARVWAEMIRDLAHMREMIAAADILKADINGRQATDTPSKLLDRFASATQHVMLAGGDASEGFLDLGERILREIDAAREGVFKPTLFTTGFSSLDRVTRHRPGEVIVTAGRPGAGKSVFAAASSRRVAQAGWGVLEFPLEIGVEQAMARHLADLCYSSSDPINFSDILNRSLEKKHHSDRVAEAYSRLLELPIVIDGAETITLPQLSAKIQVAKKQMAARGVRLAVVVVDHLDFIKASDRYAGHRTQEIAEIMIGLKALARREGVAVHLFCQLNRGVEGRDDKRPQLSDLRNSGDIEQVADVVNFLYREAYYLERSPDFLDGKPEAVSRMVDVCNVMQVICAKVRTGATGVVDLFCDTGANYLSARAR